jgi:hypothetical protein
LIIDQFEELLTTNAAHWDKRRDFFRQLDDLIRRHPNLHVVLVAREEYVPGLVTYSDELAGGMRYRFYMQLLDEDAALEAITEPAALAKRPFKQQAANKLVEQLRSLKAPGQEGGSLAQFVDPVQLQIVCFQLWEKLDDGVKEITARELEEAGDVASALLKFYDGLMARVCASPECVGSGKTERKLRRWIEDNFVSEAGKRMFVRKEEEQTAGMPNSIVELLIKGYLLRPIFRPGEETTLELAHERLIETVLKANDAWFKLHLSEWQQRVPLWKKYKHPEGLLLRGRLLKQAEVEAKTLELESEEKAYLEASRWLRRRERIRRGLGIALVALLAISVAAAILQRATSRASKPSRTYPKVTFGTMTFFLFKT